MWNPGESGLYLLLKIRLNIFHLLTREHVCVLARTEALFKTGLSGWPVAQEIKMIECWHDTEEGVQFSEKWDC